MPDLISDSSGAPDLGAVEQGDPQATAEVLMQLYRQVLQEVRDRQQEIARLERRLVAGGL